MITKAEKLLIKEVNDNLKFLLKVKPMNEKDIKDFILHCISMRIDVNKHFPETINNIVKKVYNNLDISNKFRILVK